MILNTNFPILIRIFYIAEQRLPMTALILFSSLITIVNIPFGYWRANVQRFSLQWFLAIHIPVLFVVMIRITGELDYSLSSLVLFVGSFFIGQRLGSLLLHRIKQVELSNTSCMVVDLYRYCTKNNS